MDEAFVVDTSVVMAWCFQDEANPYADSVLERLRDRRAYVPSVWPLGVLNVLLAAERRNRIGQEDSMRFVALLCRLPISVEQEHSEAMMQVLLVLARAYGLTSYDASYLELAVRKGLPLATADNRLLEAARKAGVGVVV